MGQLLQTLVFLLLLTSCPCAVITGVPFFGKRQHHTCPCLPNFICSRFLDGRYRCSSDFKNVDFLG
ncbi:PREDICTED: prokineticin-1 [Apaloderma vittatum]|uniref:prokineticin-1 n=1 Tax=Apaloderma vittatum TaxID=57397 RepID=UPI000521345D|nr:PREDICTED: prokineticin-1 [Apaloderma vittatum]